MTEQPVLLEVEDLWIEGRPPGGSFAPIVKGVSFQVRCGEVLAIIGESGSGKTTTALATLGYARPGCRISAGRALLDGRDVLSLDTAGRRDLRGRSVAYVAQSAAAAFNPARTIGWQVTEGARIHHTAGRAEASRQAVELFQRLDLPDAQRLGGRYPHQVSGGQLQRLMAAMALCCGPGLLVLDEPTTALDVTTQIEVLTALKEIIRRQHTAAIYVTHDLAVVAQIADRILVMYQGEVQERGPTEDILHNPQHDYTRTLMAAVRPSPRPADADRPGEAVAPATLLQVRGITAGYGRVNPKIVLREVTLSVGAAEVVGVIGESGCGKSTLARVIAGLLPQREGEIVHDGLTLAPAVKQRSRERLRRLQLVFQMPDVAVNPKQRVRDILGRPLEFFLGMTPGERTRRIAELLEMVELPAEFESRFPAELSGGQKQRVNLARALAAEPDLLLCDEVTSSLDAVVGAAIIKLLESLRTQLGLAYLFISHDLSTVASFADRIVVLYAGRVVEQGATRDVLAPPYHPYTRLLLSSVPELRTDWLDEVVATRETLTGIAGRVEMTEVGCPFFNRCPLAIESVCDRQTPPLRRIVGGHKVACHREVDELEVVLAGPPKRRRS